MTDTKFAYFRDTRNSDRVMTVAYYLLDDMIYFGIAICRPGLVYEHYLNGSLYQREVFAKGDTFSKKIGKKIAEGRLEKKMIKQDLVENTGVVPVQPDKRYVTSILERIVTSPVFAQSHSARRIAQAALSQYPGTLSDN